MENYYRRCGKKDAKPKEHNTRVGELFGTHIKR
jgi:hypothetical protein